MSLLACISLWPVTTRRPWLANLLGFRNCSNTERSASFICSSSGSPLPDPTSSAIQARVPTLPTPTTLRAKSVSWNCSSRIRRS